MLDCDVFFFTLSICRPPNLVSSKKWQMMYVFSGASLSDMKSVIIRYIREVSKKWYYTGNNSKIYMRLSGECQYSNKYYGSNSICTKSCVMTFMPWNGSDMLVVSVHGSFLHSIIQSIWLLAFSGILYSTVVQNTVTFLMSETKNII